MSGPQLQDVFDNVRIPVYESTKFDAPVFRSATNDVNRIFWNCFPVATPDKQEIWVQRRAAITAPLGGLTAFSSMGSVNCSAMYNITITQLTDWYIAAMYDKTNTVIKIIAYNPVNGTDAIIGTLTGVGQTDEIFLTEMNIGGTPYVGVVYHNIDSTNSKAYYAGWNGTSFNTITQITDVDFPTQLGTPDHLIGPMVQLDGTTYVSTKSGKIYGSDLNSITSWNALNIIQAIQYPDTLVGLARYKHFLVAFGNDSVEFFYDAGNPSPASPLTRTDQGFIKMGCMHPRSFVNIDDKLYWIARSSSGTAGLWTLNGLEPQKISGPAEDAIISQVTSLLSGYGPHAGRLWPFFNQGKKHLCIGTAVNSFGLAANTTFTGDTNSLSNTEFTSGGLLCMTIDDGEFWVFYNGTSQHWFFPLFAANYESYLSGKSLSDSYTPGAFIGLNWNTTTAGLTIYMASGSIDYVGSGDIGSNPVTAGFQLSSKDFGNLKLKRIHSVMPIHRGFTSSTAAASLWLLWSKNDNATVAAGDVTVTRQGAQKLTIPVSNNRFLFKRLGAARSWTFAMVCKSTFHWAFKDLELFISQGVR